MATDAMASVPNAPDLAALLNAAMERHQAGDLKTAAARYAAVLAQAPDHPEALYLSGALDYGNGATEDAQGKLERSLAVRPGYLPAVEMLGAVALQNRNFELAARCFKTAAAQQPAALDAHFRLGHALFFAGAYDDAVTALRRALSLKPDSTDALYVLAATLRTQRKFQDAAGVYAQLISLKPTHAAGLDEYAAVLFELGRRPEAEATARRAIAAAPDQANPYTNLGRIYQTDLARAGEALALHDQALTRRPDYADAHNNKGAALLTLSRFDEAIASFRHALALKPAMAEAHNNLGNALLKINDVATAEIHYRQATALRPDYAEAHFNIALLSLTKNNFTGWDEYEWRWQCRDFTCPRRTFAQPQWQGDDIPGGTLLIWGEQGLGDEVLYSSMVDELITRGFKITLECASRLVPLMARSFPAAEVVAYSEPPSPLTAAPRMQCSSASLGRILRRDIAHFPTQRGSYLRADQKRAHGYRQRLLENGKRRVVGVSWSSKNPEFGMHKTSRLTAWKAIWDAAGADTAFVDLQYGDTATERAAAQAAGMSLAHLPDLDLLNDIDGVAALLAACDSVISVSNTTAHLAGALGVSTYVMVPCGHGQMWYWGAGERGSLWYPSAQVFRQHRLDDWDDVIARIAQRLATAS